ncbi:MULTISPECIES: hypothetical protein [Halorubrum]|nr:MULTISPECIES: hypothetical protein [Halorubrum]
MTDTVPDPAPPTNSDDDGEYRQHASADVAPELFGDAQEER